MNNSTKIDNFIINKNIHKYNLIYYNLIILATILSIFSLVPFIYEIIQQKITSNIPYVSLFCISFTFIIFMYISISKGYFLHLFLYTFGLLCIFIIIFFKRKYDSKNIVIHKSIENIYKHKINDENSLMPNK
jgi:hypothetical protein